MTQRLKAVKRIVKVQAQMKTLADHKVAASEQKRHAIAKAQDELSAFMEGGDALGGIGLAALRQAGRLARRHEAAAAETSSLSDVAREAQRRLKGAEQVADAVKRSHREAEERRTLEQIIEAAAAQARARRDAP